MGEDLNYLDKKVALKWYCRKVFIIWSYIFDYIKNGEIRLIWILFKSLIIGKSNSKDLIVNTYYGKFLIRKHTMDFKMANKAYEYKAINLFCKELTHKDIVIDIGANSGLYSLVAAKYGIHSLAFEPVNLNFNSLLKNIEINKQSNLVKAFNFGLGDNEEKVKFNFNDYNTGAASKYQIRMETTETDVEIKVFDKLEIEDLINAKNVLVKIDVEGMEVNVIEGMQNFIKSTPEISYIIEVKHTGVEDVKNTLLKYANFEFKTIDTFNIFAKKLN